MPDHRGFRSTVILKRIFPAWEAADVILRGNARDPSLVRRILADIRDDDRSFSLRQ
jgi:hypothetical protein